MPDTGFKAATATGETYDDWTGPEQAFTDGGGSDVSAAYALGEKQQDYSDFDFGVPSGANIDGIEVGVLARADTNNTKSMDCIIYGDGFYTSAKNKEWDEEDGNYYTKTYGGSSDLWSKSWDSDDFSDANFRVRFDTVAAGDLYIDYIKVKVYYTEYMTGVKSVNEVVKTNIKSINGIDTVDIDTINSI